MSPVLPSRFNPPDSHLPRFTTLFIRISPLAHYSFSSRFLTSTLPSSFISANRECLLLQRSSEYGVCVCVCVSIDVSDSRYFPAECRGVSEKKKKKRKKKTKGRRLIFPSFANKIGVHGCPFVSTNQNTEYHMCVSRSGENHRRKRAVNILFLFSERGKPLLISRLFWTNTLTCWKTVARAPRTLPFYLKSQKAEVESIDYDWSFGRWPTDWTSKKRTRVER